MVVRGRKIRKRLSPEQRREEILFAAHQVFVACDPATVTFEDIAAQAGVSRALVYNYFGDKGTLLAEVYQHAVAELDEQLLSDLAEAQPMALRLHHIVAHYVAFAEARAGIWHILGHVAATQHPATLAVRRARIDAFAAALDDTPATRVATAGLIGMVEEALSQWLLHPEVTSAELLEVLSRQAWAGLAGLLDNRVGEYVS
ncbi:MAG: TetR/AcrR family transcriptional regulator [Acidimicrobiales bacterium]|nr:TetR/AcrR family transcriptional regulator [Acidimicrobiales bacterium]